MAKHLAWDAYYTLVQKYLKLCRAKDTLERIYVSTLVSLLDSFYFPMEDIAPEVEDDQEGDDDVEEGVDADVVQDHTAADVLPQPASSSQTARIADAVKQRLLPSLLNRLEKHNTMTDDNTRIPIDIGIINVAKHLPLAT
jgi:U3 small nucleolar RNA-associated protein 20